MWWPMGPSYVSASEAFDRRHLDRTSRAERLLAHVLADSTSSSKALAFEASLYEVCTNRFVRPHVQKEGKVYRQRKPPPPPRAAAAPKPKDHMIIWSARAKWSDSKDIYDTVEVKCAKLDTDYKRALVECKLGKFILEHDDEYVPPAKGARRATAEELAATSYDEEHEIAEVRRVTVPLLL